MSPTSAQRAWALLRKQLSAGKMSGSRWCLSGAVHPLYGTCTFVHTAAVGRSLDPVSHPCTVCADLVSTGHALGCTAVDTTSTPERAALVAHLVRPVNTTGCMCGVLVQWWEAGSEHP